MESNESEITRLFFEGLAQRKSKENDLSDVTWAMCMASESFCRDFLNFFFPGIDFEDAEIIRESTEGDSRPDFRINTPRGLYLIEVKIYDSNHHFQQYVATFGIPPKRLGYITNYEHKEPGFVVHQWKELVAYLSKRIPEAEENLWGGYLKYVKRVCNLIEYTRPMNISALYTICELNTALSEVCVMDAGNYRTSFNGYQKTLQQGEFGVYFDVYFRATDHGKFTHGGGSFAVKFDMEQPELMIYFTRGSEWGGPLYDKLSGCVSSIRATRLCKKPTDDGNYIVFTLATEEFEGLATYAEQKNLLEQFFLEVMTKVYNTALAKK